MIDLDLWPVPIMAAGLISTMILVGAFVWALCKAAALGDRPTVDQADADERWQAGMDAYIERRAATTAAFAREIDSALATVDWTVPSSSATPLPVGVFTAPGRVAVTADDPARSSAPPHAATSPQGGVRPDFTSSGRRTEPAAVKTGARPAAEHRAGALTFMPWGRV